MQTNIRSHVMYLQLTAGFTMRMHRATTCSAREIRSTCDSVEYPLARVTKRRATTRIIEVVVK